MTVGLLRHVAEGFEVTGGSGTCIVHRGDNVTTRDVLVRDCPQHGILGTDFESLDVGGGQ